MTDKVIESPLRVEAMDGFSVAVGDWVKFHSRRGSRGIGIVRGFRVKGGVDHVLIDPDWKNTSLGGDYWMIRERVDGRTDYFEPRDWGVSLGCISAKAQWKRGSLSGHGKWEERDDV